MAEKGLECINFLETNDVNVKTFRCDNAGEIEKFKEKLRELGKNIKKEFLAPGTPQQNRKIERAFATMYGRVRAMMNYAKFEGELRKKLGAECAKTATDLDCILIQDKNNKSNYEKMFGRNPAFLMHLRILGEMEIIMVHKQEGHKSMIEDRGKEPFSLDTQILTLEMFSDFLILQLNE